MTTTCIPFLRKNVSGLKTPDLAGNASTMISPAANKRAKNLAIKQFI
jgi:hypothetical protein